MWPRHSIVTPTGDGAADPHPAGVQHPGADGDEGARRRRCLAESIAAPTGDGAIAPHLAGVVPPALTETKNRGRRGLTVFIAAPAGDGAADPHPAGVVPPSADGVKGTPGRVALPSPFQPQQATEPSLLNPQV